ncbi:lamin tail domain-containing protein [Algoriphagus sp. D3-2-R+10]|uniref:lamin tail domain-containing protein n=1 Tax=Algoriphagus aurantiacus TaxID=3103948 RepID=UPI002B3CFA48|nr:lamin tail domain-containing protein [Algoriphagus sp. D3-2-R+10]MEB2774948.1 lamin tail domain-containing protein [Algoriphagus sp. D3-2-R+10]
MLGLFFIWQLIYFSVLVQSDSQAEFSNQVQTFEGEFNIQSYPNEFLPGWYANELRGTSSRIYQANSVGKNGSKALAVQPISTFNGEVNIRLSPQGLNDPKVRFWARSVRNGSGSRSAEVFYSWGMDLDGNYSEREILDGANEFANEDQEFRLFELVLPDVFSESAEVFLRLEIRYGSGVGSCAKWLMDDFEFGEFVEDKTPPKVKRVRGFDSNQVEIQFNEAIDPIFSEFLINYKLNELEPIEAKLTTDSLVYLSFEEKLEIGKSYDMEILQIPDLEGNFLQDTVISFQFFDPTYIPPKTLVINEIMPAPKADLDLPNVEYVEIYQAGEYAVRLEGVSLSNSRSTVNLQDEWILPGEIILLVPENQASLLAEYGKVIPVKSWPTLLNSGDQLSLKDDQGKLIDMVSYSTSSWGGSEFASGGYSLEVANPFYACEQSDLLSPSIDPLRGSPGRQNSIFDLSPDENLPVLNSFEFTSSKSLLVTFSKPILADFDKSNFVFEPSLEIDSIANTSSKQISLHFSEEVTPNKIYSLDIKDLTDCSGNSFLQSESLQLVLPVQAKIGDVLINELLFNPKTGSPKFVELINVTDNYLEVKDWKLANLDDVGEVDQVKQLSENSIIIPPKGFVAITTNPDMLKLDFPKSAFGEFVKIVTLPSYPIAGGTVVLLDSAEAVAESFTYSEDLHHPLLRDPKGVSLERLSRESPATLPANWHSASSMEEYATPGRRNSQVIDGEFEGELIQIDPAIFDPEGSNGNTFTTFRYELGQSGWIGSFRVYSTSGQLIQVLAQNELLGASGLFTWTGTDSQGKIVRPGYYILLVELYDLSGQVKTIRKTVIIASKL